jgi:two-component system, response regulator / RNA-binding antiterminator
MPAAALTKREADAPGIVLLADDPARAADRAAALAAASCRMLATLPAQSDSIGAASALAPDIVVVEAASPTPALLEIVRAIHHDRACAIVLLVDERGSCSIEDALRAGVTSYVIGGIDRRQVRPILDIAVARFNETRMLYAELNRAKAALDERKIVERAKGVLMKERRIGEEEAYRALRRLAMERNKRIVDIAEAILTYAQVSRSQ